MNISYTLNSMYQTFHCLPALPLLPQPLFYSSSVPLPALTCLPPASSFTLTPTTIGLTSQTTPQPSKDSRPFRRFWGRVGEESSIGLVKGRGRVLGGGSGFSFPLNCPTWLSVLSLNKHSHFLLTAHIGTQTQACARTHINTHQLGKKACLNSNTQKQACTHIYKHICTQCIVWPGRQQSVLCSLVLQPVNSQLSLDSTPKHHSSEDYSLYSLP